MIKTFGDVFFHIVWFSHEKSVHSGSEQLQVTGDHVLLTSDCFWYLPTRWLQLLKVSTLDAWKGLQITFHSLLSCCPYFHYLEVTKNWEAAGGWNSSNRRCKVYLKGVKSISSLARKNLQKGVQLWPNELLCQTRTYEWNLKATRNRKRTY